MKCGCHVRAHLDDNKTLTGSINFCPLHAAAPEMLEALKDIVEQYQKTRLPVGPDLGDSIRVFGQQAISQAERKE